MKLFNSTKKWSSWWQRRKIDWKTHYMNPDHPHRTLLAQVVNSSNWLSLIELGCGAGANLVTILKGIKGAKQLGGVDINPDAIALANQTFRGGLFKVNSGDDVMMSDKATDVILTDMYLIYMTPSRMKKQLTEIKRLTRSHVVFCEFHSKSWWQRLVLKYKEGYNMYNYQRLLEKHGFYDISLFKIPKDFWPESDLQQKYAYIVVARVPRDY